MEQLFYNGIIHTLDAASRRAEALAVSGDRIVAVGSEGHCRQRLAKPARSVDLQGCAVLPGFIDTHMHPILTAYYEMQADLQAVTNFDGLRVALRAHERTLGPERWLVGMRYGENTQTDSRPLTRQALDEISLRPTVVVQFDGHKVFANSAAIRAAAISSATPDPAGGTIARDPAGDPAGAFFENASQLILSAVPFPDLEELRRAAHNAFARFAAQGITGLGAILQAGETGPAGKTGAAERLAFSLLHEDIPQRCYVLAIADTLAPLDELAQTAIFGTDAWSHRRLGGLKVFSDGTFGSRTACLCAGYADAPADRGYMLLADEEIYRTMEAAHLANRQIAVHAIGDEASRRCLMLYRRLLQAHPRPHRHRIEHASLLNAALVQEIAELGIVVATQPSFIRSERGFLPGRLGERTAMVYPLKSLFDAGAVVAGSSDAPIDHIGVLHAVAVATRRDGFVADQCISVEQAFRMYTSNAAYAQFEEHVCGTLEPGKRADFVVLDGDPFAVPPQMIETLRVLETQCGGKTIYAAT